MWCMCVCLALCRWRWSPTSWTISCATSARGRAAGASLRPSSAPTWPACSTTASSAGPTSTRVPAESSTSPWWRKAPTGLARSTSAGTEDGQAERGPRVRSVRDSGMEEEMMVMMTTTQHEAGRSALFCYDPLPPPLPLPTIPCPDLPCPPKLISIEYVTVYSISKYEIINIYKI